MEALTSASPPPARTLFKNMLKGSSLYMVAMASPSLLSLILVPVVTRRLSTAEYGAVDLLQMVSVVISVLLGLNFASTLGYFYFEAEARKSRVVGTALLLALSMGTIAGTAGWMLASPISNYILQSPEYIPYLHLIFASMPLSFLLEAGFSWLRTENRAALFTGVVLVRLVLILAGTLTLMLGFGLGIGAVLGANVVAASITALLIAAAAIRFHGVSVSLALFLRMWRFSVPVSISAVALFVIHFGDRFILKHYWSFADLGVYAVAYKLGMLLNPLQAAFESYWSAQAFQIVKRPDAEAVFARTLTYWALVLSACALGLLVATRPALRILTRPAYFRAASLIPIVLAAYYVRALGDFFRIVLLAKGLPSHDAACNWITAVVSVCSYFVLIPRYGIMGAAIATLFTFLVAFVISFIWSSRIWSFPLEGKRLFKLGAVTGALCVVYLALPAAGNVIEIGRGVVILTSFAGLLLLWRFPNPGEMDLLRSIRARVAAFHPR